MKINENPLHECVVSCNDVIPISSGADERIPSTLVFEVEDSPNQLRHIVAVTPVHAVKLRRRYPHAKKLHVYNDHLFTATHIKRYTTHKQKDSYSTVQWNNLSLVSTGDTRGGAS